MLPPMKLMIASELGSTGEPEMSWFQALLAGKGTKPLRLAPWPVEIPLHRFCVPLEPVPPVPPLDPPELPPPDCMEDACEPPQAVSDSITANKSPVRTKVVLCTGSASQNILARFWRCISGNEAF